MTQRRAGEPDADLDALAAGGRTNIFGFLLRLLARLPFLFVAGRLYGPETVGRFAVAILVVEFAALIATLGLKRGLAQALQQTERPHANVAWDALAAAGIAALLGALALVIVPQAMFPNSGINPLDRLLPLAVLAIAWTDILLAALAYRHNVRAAVTARAVIEPWTISIAALAFAFYSTRDGLIMAYGLSTVAALIAAFIPFIRSYGRPIGWKPRVPELFALARANAPLAGADAIEWATRNVDRAILGLMFSPAVVGVYFMAQQVASIPQKLKTSFDPILGPVVTKCLAEGDRKGVAKQVCQVGFWIIAAQAGLALMGAIPSEAVMGVVGPQFVAGAIALVFLLIAEVLAATGAVSESALVYVARGRNLAISVGVLALQIALSFTFIALLPPDAPIAWQAATTALALAVAVTMGSVLKARLLKASLGAGVSPFRWPLIAAIVVAALVGHVATRWAEWAELVVGVPLIFAAYVLVLWRFAFGPEDRALFRRPPTR